MVSPNRALGRIEVKPSVNIKEILASRWPLRLSLSSSGELLNSLRQDSPCFEIRSTVRPYFIQGPFKKKTAFLFFFLVSTTNATHRALKIKNKNTKIYFSQ